MGSSVFDASDVLVETDVWCEMPDGVKLAADIYRPAVEGSCPTLLMRTPYDKTLAQSDVGYAHPSWYARQGYLVVIQDCRGRGNSEGEYYYDRHEADDGYHTIEWAARLSGSSGRVGMYGFSYVGYVQLLAATRRPPSLATIIPAFIYGRMYDVLYNSGALVLGIAASAAIFHAMQIARRDGNLEEFESLRREFERGHESYWTLPLTDYPSLSEASRNFLGEWLDHPTYDEYWRPYSVSDDYSRIDIPALHLGGWYDICLAGTLGNFRGLSEGGTNGTPQKLVIGPWFHMPWGSLDRLENPDAPGDADANFIDDLQIRWFDHLLKDTENDVASRSVSVYIMGHGWQEYDDWPPREAVRKTFYLHSQGRANTAAGDGSLSERAPKGEAPDVFVYDPAHPVMSEGGHSCCWIGVTPMGPECQKLRESSKGVLVYTSEPAERDMKLVGEAGLVLYAASSAIDTDFTARLCIVNTEGCSRNLQEGIVRARCRESLTEPSMIEPGGIYEYAITLVGVGTVVRAGERIRVDISSSDFPQWDRNLNTGGAIGKERLADAIVATQIVFHDVERPSHLYIDTLATDASYPG